MIRQFRICACACALAACAAAETGDAAAEETAEGGATNAAETVAQVSDDAGFARYRTILDRMPFGPEPENFNPDDPSSGDVGAGGAAGAAAAAAAAKSAEERQILASVRVSALNVTPSGKIAVGFTDGSRQPAAVYYLKVGESRDGWTVKEANADPKEMTVTLERDGVSATLKLGEGTGGGKAAPGRAAARPAVLSQRRPLLQSNAPVAVPNAVAPVAVPPPLDAAAKPSPYAMLRARQARAAQAREEAAKRREEAAAQAKAERAAEQERLQAERAQQQAAQEELSTRLTQLAEEVKRASEARQQQPPAAEEEGGPADQTPE